MLTRRQALAATALAALLAASPARAQQRLNVIASFSILGDFVKNVGGDGVEVATLVGPNGNAHVYAPSPGDAKKVADAKLVFVNGLGFEGWLERLVKASGTKAPIVVATKGIKPLEPALEAQPIDEHELGIGNPLGIAGRGRVDVGIAVGADQGCDLDAVAADVLHEVAQDREAGNDVEPILSARGSGDKERGERGRSKRLSSGQHRILLYGLGLIVMPRGGGRGRAGAPGRRRGRTATSRDRARRRPE